MKPLPWSHTALSDFKNCPRSFHETRVSKRIKREQGEEAAWGERVHKAFENRMATRETLPAELANHEEFFAKLEEHIRSGTHWCETQIGFDTKAKPCAFFAQNVWFRGVIDFKWIHDTQPLARIIDYKTGKPRDKWDQMDVFALHTFALHPVDLVDARYYWTQTHSMTRKVYGRAEIGELWAKHIPDLKQYAEAFKNDTWQPRQSGLCNGWCPVTDCEFWREKRPRR